MLLHMKPGPIRTRWPVIRTAILALALALAPVTARAGEVITGPIAADVVSIYDGDTLTVDAHPWPQVTIRVSVRVDGVDTPELRGQCGAEKAQAIAARDFVRETVGSHVTLSDVRLGKYAGRVVAVVFLEDGLSLADVLIAAGLGRHYEGGKREGWCG